MAGAQSPRAAHEQSGEQSGERSGEGSGEGSGQRTRHRTVRLPFALSAVRTARAEVVADLTARALPGEVVDEAETVVAELVTNAVRHAGPLPDGSVRLHWQIRDCVVELEVTDGGGRTRPQALPANRYAGSGRGLRIVRSLAHEWGVIEQPGLCPAPAPGRTVWASVGGPSRRRAW